MQANSMPDNDERSTAEPTTRRLWAEPIDRSIDAMQKEKNMKRSIYNHYNRVSPDWDHLPCVRLVKRLHEMKWFHGECEILWSDKVDTKEEYTKRLLLDKFADIPKTVRIHITYKEVNTNIPVTCKMPWERVPYEIFVNKYASIISHSCEMAVNEIRKVIGSELPKLMEKQELLEKEEKITIHNEKQKAYLKSVVDTITDASSTELRYSPCRGYTLSLKYVFNPDDGDNPQYEINGISGEFCAEDIKRFCEVMASSSECAKRRFLQ